MSFLCVIETFFVTRMYHISRTLHLSMQFFFLFHRLSMFSQLLPMLLRSSVLLIIEPCSFLSQRFLSPYCFVLILSLGIIFLSRTANISREKKCLSDQRQFCFKDLFRSSVCYSDSLHLSHFLFVLRYKCQV